MKNLKKFIDNWKIDKLDMKPVFLSLFQDIESKADVMIEFHERPGITYSLRGIHKNQKDRPLFVMIDVIDDDPKQRWLSVCFYGGTIDDPDEEGDLIPEGLLGLDGYCFDLVQPDETLKAYILKRIQEAYENAGNG